jgi:hypothetical protein
MLSLWSACAAHCGTEGFFHSTISCYNLTAEKSNHAPGSAEQCVCGFIQSGDLLAQRDAVAVPLPDQSALTVILAPCLTDSALPLIRRQWLLAPPELLSDWQFFVRAAAPPRAPSFVS